MGLASAALVVLALGVGGGWERRITAHYTERAMTTVLRNRQADYEQGKGPFIPPASCYMAHPTAPLGTWMQIKGVRTGRVLRCVVADTSRDVDRARHIRTRLIEVDWGSALLLCGSRSLRNDECPTLVRLSP